ncbi:MAG: hypothetical protein ACKOSS_04875, partial [Planctomycetia bacterium]
NEALDRATAWLRAQQKPGVGWVGQVVQRGTGWYQVGSSALVGLALLSAGDRRGTRPDEGVVDRIMTACRGALGPGATSYARTTYDVSVLIMFTLEYWRPHGKAGAKAGSTREGRGDNPCSLPPEVKAWVEELAAWLAARAKSQEDSSTPARELGGWGYPHDRPDMSNTQYALLGLRAARDCGCEVDVGAFERALDFALAWQDPDGPKSRRLLPASEPGGTPYVIESADRARGWPYLLQPGGARTGSMTTAGIAVLSIAHDALLRPRALPRYDGARQRQVAQAIQDGFAWLDANWTVARNSGAGAPNWHHYYLYGLERAAALCGRPLVGLHDWYVEGAQHLVGTQHADGHWSTGALGMPGEIEASDLLDTAWAVLFLKRATRPLPPVNPPVVTGGG